MNTKFVFKSNKYGQINDNLNKNFSAFKQKFCLFQTNLVKQIITQARSLQLLNKIFV